MLLNQPLGNEVLSREQLLNIVPIFVAVLVWLTRILFIGAMSIAGNQWVQPTIIEKEKRGKPLQLKSKTRSNVIHLTEKLPLPVLPCPQRHH